MLWVSTYIASTLNRSYKWPPFIFYTSSESQNQSCKIYGSINKQRLCRDSGRNFISHRRCPSKGTLISKRHTFYCNIKHSKKTLLIYCFTCLKMLLTGLIQDEQGAKILTQVDSSFLLCNTMKTITISSLIREIQH